MLVYMTGGLGTVLIPVIAGPFLSERNSTTGNTTDWLCDPGVGGNTTRSDNDVTREARIEIPYIIVACLIALAALSHLVFVIIGPPKDWPTRAKGLPVRQMINPGSCSDGHIFYGSSILLTAALYIGAANGGQVALMNYLSLVSVCGELKMSPRRAATANSLFSATFTVGRLVGAPCVRYININKLIVMVIIMNCTSMLAMCLWGQRLELVYWTTVPLTAFFTSLLLPTGISWTSQTLSMNSMGMMVLMVGSGIGQNLMIILAGLLLENWGMPSVLWSPFAAYALLPIFFLFMFILRRLYLKVKDKQAHDISVTKL